MIFYLKLLSKMSANTIWKYKCKFAIGKYISFVLSTCWIIIHVLFVNDYQIISIGRNIAILCSSLENESTNCFSKHLLLIWYPWVQKMSNQERRIRGKRDIIKYSLRNLMGWLSVNLNYIEWDSHATTASPSINPIFSKFDMHTSCVYKLKIVKYVTDWLPWNTLDMYL